MDTTPTPQEAPTAPYPDAREDYAADFEAGGGEVCGGAADAAQAAADLCVACGASVENLVHSLCEPCGVDVSDVWVSRGCGWDAAVAVVAACHTAEGCPRRDRPHAPHGSCPGVAPDLGEGPPHGSLRPVVLGGRFLATFEAAYGVYEPGAHRVGTVAHRPGVGWVAHRPGMRPSEARLTPSEALADVGWRLTRPTPPHPTEQEAPMSTTPDDLGIHDADDLAAAAAIRHVGDADLYSLAHALGATRDEARRSAAALGYAIAEHVSPAADREAIRSGLPGGEHMSTTALAAILADRQAIILATLAAHLVIEGLRATPGLIESVVPTGRQVTLDGSLWIEVRQPLRDGSAIRAWCTLVPPRRRRAGRARVVAVSTLDAAYRSHVADWGHR